MVESFKGLKPFKMISLAFGVNGMGLGILFGKKTIFFLSFVCFQFKDLQKNNILFFNKIFFFNFQMHNASQKV